MANKLVNSLNIFLGIREPNVTFCLDISGSMYNSLNIVKEQLIQYLLEQSVLAKLNLNRLFNLIAFSTEVYPWASSMVLWNTSTVNSAINWIKDLETQTGTNTLDALITAFKDEMNHAVVLVTDDIPDQEPYQVLNQISYHARGRPVHCIYITNGRDEDRSAIEFLQNLSTMTRGFFKIVNIGRFGVEKITPINQDMSTHVQLTNLALNAAGYATLGPVVSRSVTNLYPPAPMVSSFAYPNWLNKPDVYTYPSFVSFPKVVLTQDGRIPDKSVAWSRFRPVKVLYDGTVCGLTAQNNYPITKDIAYTPDAGSLLTNKAVLARSNLDGYYYKGKIYNQILAHRFMVQFGPNQHGKYLDSIYQDTAIYDIIHYDDAYSHSIKTKDKVLALMDGKEKYAPAEVLEGYEKRSSSPTDSDSQLTVSFCNGKTRTLPFNEAIWIPDAMFERINFELNLPSIARKYLEELNEDYPLKSLPGYPVKANETPSLDYVIMPRMIYDIWPYFVPFYPLYSGLYPTLSGCNVETTSFLSNTPSTAPVYYRSVRSNPAVVDAESINKSIMGSQLTPDQLDDKIREQIHKNRHLLRPKSPEIERTHSCLCQRPVSPPACLDKNHIKEQSNKYYEEYLEKIKKLYDDVRSESWCDHRAKSVTFMCHSDDECDPKENKSVNTEISFTKNTKPKLQSLSSNVPDRFGNPKVNIGLPDRPGLKPKPNFVSTSMDSIGFKREKVFQREQERLDKMNQHFAKEELRDQYHRNYSNEVAQFEKRRTEMADLKNMERNLGKKELKQNYTQQIDSGKVDIEAKEQAKMAYLRNLTNKRNLESMYKVKENEFKEANKVAYKKLEQDKRNQFYHDRLLVEEAFRKAQQAHSKKVYTKNH